MGFVPRMAQVGCNRQIWWAIPVAHHAPMVTGNFLCPDILLLMPLLPVSCFFFFFCQGLLSETTEVVWYREIDCQSIEGVQ